MYKGKILILEENVEIIELDTFGITIMRKENKDKVFDTIIDNSLRANKWQKGLDIKRVCKT